MMLRTNFVIGLTDDIYRFILRTLAVHSNNLKITERNTDPSLFTHCIEPKIAIVSINQNALAEY